MHEFVMILHEKRMKEKKGKIYKGKQWYECMKKFRIVFLGHMK
jgi:hypothetical protein